MTECQIGRAITHPDAEQFPGFQQPCPRQSEQILVISNGVSVQRHNVCAAHMTILHRAGIVSEPRAVRR